MTRTLIIKYLLHGLTLLILLAQLTNWALVGSGLFVIAYQAYTYLHLGYWPSMSLLSAMLDYRGFLGVFGDWAQHSSSWPGLHRAMKFMPLSVFLIFCGFLIEFLSQGKLKDYVIDLTEKHQSRDKSATVN